MARFSVPLATLAAVCAAFTTSCNQPLLNPEVVNPDHAVVYLVSGTVHSAHVVFVDVKGKNAETSVPLPWKYEFFAKSGMRAYLSATRLHGAGTLKPTITSDGKAVFGSSDTETDSVLVGLGRNLP